MKVFAISDLHLSIHSPKPMDIFGGAWDNYVEDILADWKAKVTQDDMVIIAGDISWAMTLDKAVPDLNFIGALSGKKIILRGNHDYWWKTISGIRALLPKNMYAVQNDYVRLDDVLICGSRGWTTPEGKAQSDDDKKIYEREVLRMGMSLESMNKVRKEGDRVIAMCHYPPYNSRFEPTPFTDMFSKYKVDAVVYGHLHGNKSKACLNVSIDGINYYLTSCDILQNKLIQIL